MAKLISFIGGLLMLVAVAGISWGMLTGQSAVADAKWVSAPTAPVATAPEPAEVQEASVVIEDRAVTPEPEALAVAPPDGPEPVAEAPRPAPPNVAELAATVRDVDAMMNRIKAQHAADMIPALQDLSDRCWDSVVYHKPFDATGLERASDEVIDFDTPLSRQVWTHPETGWAVIYKTERNYLAERPLRVCQVATDYRPDPQAAQFAAFREDFDSWFDARSLAGSFAPFERETHANQVSMQSRHGSAGGCPITVNFFTRSLLAAEARFEVKEDGFSGCGATPFAAPGEVKVNRLVQVTQ